ncbi:flagellar protein FlgN [Yoonia litorea]|uniref:FlgN protein n=1 Tax=Yoonia litorea TaxID=1123755 RepID=A0A1I6MUG0_9RHOB|nr:flagellar protein FlgN [Yoonia litorea]SFS19178.1 hypothetical protein SAMN05444714_2116 [Yoonia litorea]
MMSLIEKLHGLLDEERLLLRSGQIDQLADIARQKETLMLKLPGSRMGRAEAMKLSDALQRNQTLLAAAISGVQAARQRLKVLRSVHEGLTTYDGNGRLATRGQKTGTVEKKA